MVLQATRTKCGTPCRSARYLDNGRGRWSWPKKEKIEIFSRDIFRGEYAHYIEKEIHEASESVRNTLHGKYVRKQGGKVDLPARGVRQRPGPGGALGKTGASPR